jgi:FkbM family methyltransferase
MRSLLALSERALLQLGFDRLALLVRAQEFLRNGEPEARLLSLLVDRDRTAVDVGASNGVYTWHLRRLAKTVIAFEPNPKSFCSLRKASPDLDIRQIALSSKDRRDTLRVPICKNVTLEGWGTLHPGNHFAELTPEATESFTVDVARLDDLGLKDVGFMKIDVEGHENEVVEGGGALLARDRPNLLVEAGGEVRGNDPRAIFRTLQSLGYVTFFLEHGAKLTSIDRVPANLASVNIIAIPKRPPHPLSQGRLQYN